MVVVRFALASLVAVSLASLAACASGECETLESCDIREHGCQDQVAKVVACLRGSRAVTPKFEVVDADRFIDERASEADETPLDDATQARYRALSLFELMPAEAGAGDLARHEWSQVAAFYDSDTHRVTVLDRGSSMDGAGAVVLLAHELVHAQQARETKDAFYPAADDSRDAGWAASALVEGEATVYQDLADVLGYGFEAGDLDWPQIYRDFESFAWLDASREPAIYQRADSSFSYAFGGAYLSQAYRKGGRAEVRKAVRSAPASTREVTAGYPRHADRFEIESLDDVAVPILPETFVYVSSDRAGAYLFESFLARWVQLVAARPDLVKTGVTGDSLSTFRFGADQSAVFWRLRFASIERAMAVEALFGPAPELVVKREDRDLIFAAISDMDMRDLIAGELSWAAAPAAQVETEGIGEPKRAAQLRCAFRRLDQH